MKHNILRSVRPLLLLTLAIIAGTHAFADNRALRINEVLLHNTSGILDEYGTHRPWIEFYNPSAATINLGGMYLTDDPSQPTKYQIRNTHRGTIIPPYQILLIYIDGKPELGTFHSGLWLEPNKEHTIYLFEGDGKQLIDQVTIPASLPENHSYARKSDGGEGWEVVALPTPADLNSYSNTTAQRIEEFQLHDPSGLVMTLIAMAVVFLSLAVLWIIFLFVGKLNMRSEARRTAKKAGVTHKEATDRLNIPAGTYAAIAVALYEHTQKLHDDDGSVVTITETRRRYSPWSSKIHTLREVPQVVKRKNTK